MPAARRGRGQNCAAAVLAAVLLLSSLPAVISQQDDDYDDDAPSSSAALPFITQAVYNSLMNVTTGFVMDFSKSLSFCVKDTNKYWNDTFNFSSDITFLSNCITKTKGDPVFCDSYPRASGGEHEWRQMVYATPFMEEFV